MRTETTPIAVTFVDGSLGIMQFVTHQYDAKGQLAWARPATHGAIQAEINKSVFEQPVRAWRAINPIDIPEDRTYRNAWRDTGSTIGHDMNTARAWHRQLIRLARAIALPELDAEWMRATGQGNQDEADAVEAQRLVWRDAPADLRIDAATTIQELRAIDMPTRKTMTLGKAIRHAFKQLRGE